MFPSLVFLVVLQSTPVVQPTSTVCQDIQRVELSLERGALKEICISPGLLTGFVFDSVVDVDLEEEIRFAEVTRGRTTFSFMPPGDGLVGERLRLTAHFVDGASVTFVLVMQSGQATRQVEVYRDKRTRESFLYEIAQGQARYQQLQQEFERLQHQLEQGRAECGEPTSMRRLIASKSVSEAGIRISPFPQETLNHSENYLKVVRGFTLRSDKRVAVAVWLLNSSEETWSVVATSLADTEGTLLKGVHLWREGDFIAPHEYRLIVVEIEVEVTQTMGDLTVHLREEGPRAITLPRVVVPR